MIRAARPADAPAIAAIWNAIIRDTTATFNATEKTDEEVADLVVGRATGPHCFLVAEEGGGVAGFATTFAFRGGSGYRHTVEHTLHLIERARGRGLGRALLAATVTQARDAGHHSIIAGISGENEGAVAFHTRCGFTHVATIPQVGRKFDRWFDLVLMQRML